MNSNWYEIINLQNISPLLELFSAICIVFFAEIIDKIKKEEISDKYSEYKDYSKRALSKLNKKIEKIKEDSDEEINSNNDNLADKFDSFDLKIKKLKNEKIQLEKLFCEIIEKYSNTDKNCVNILFLNAFLVGVSIMFVLILNFDLAFHSSIVFILSFVILINQYKYVKFIKYGNSNQKDKHIVKSKNNKEIWESKNGEKGKNDIYLDKIITFMKYFIGSVLISIALNILYTYLNKGNDFLKNEISLPIFNLINVFTLVFYLRILYIAFKQYLERDKTIKKLTNKFMNNLETEISECKYITHFEGDNSSDQSVTPANNT